MFTFETFGKFYSQTLPPTTQHISVLVGVKLYMTGGTKTTELPRPILHYRLTQLVTSSAQLTNDWDKIHEGPGQVLVQVVEGLPQLARVLAR